MISGNGTTQWNKYPLTVAFLCFSDNDVLGESGENNYHLYMDAVLISTERWVKKKIRPFYLEFGGNND